jgi:predicted nucleic acid-binding protein
MPEKLVIANSTPIIALRGIGRLDILKSVYERITIPDAVLREVTVKNRGALQGIDWVIVKPISNIEAKALFTAALHEGEVEVMILARELNADLVIIDDGLARRHAKYIGLTVTGTVGVLLRAKRDGIISVIKPILADLIKSGFFISQKVCDDILRMADEV